MKPINAIAVVFFLTLGFFSAQVQASCGHKGCNTGIACADDRSAFGDGENFSLDLRLVNGALVLRSVSGQTLDQGQCTGVMNQEHFYVDPNFSNIDCKSKVFKYKFESFHTLLDGTSHATVSLKDVSGRVYQLICAGYVYAKE